MSGQQSTARPAERPAEDRRPGPGQLPLFPERRAAEDRSAALFGARPGREARR
jgi:hypothetical protein